MNDKIIENRELNIFEALIPVFALIIMLSFNVLGVFKDDALGGSNQFILLLGASVAAIVGHFNNVRYDKMIAEVADNLRSTTGAILILLMVGALSGAWLISGIIPAMIYYGLKLLTPVIFLPVSIIICAIISVATGSSWTTSATVGIALIGIGKAIGLNPGMVAGAVLSGAYFGDKLSPLSDTTNLAPAMAGTDLFTHIRYMVHTTVPSIAITMAFFIVISIFNQPEGSSDTQGLLQVIESTFNISPFLFIVPAAVIFMIIKKTKPLVALLVGSLLGAVFAVIFQSAIIEQLIQAGGYASKSAFTDSYRILMIALTSDTAIDTGNTELNDLFVSGGMKGMLGTIWLIICAMVFGGVMEAIGALSRISNALLSLSKSVFGLFASTVASCLAINITASDQYLSIVIPGKMFAKAYEEKNLAPENLSRTLEDSGTVTSVLIPWNTCGAYHSGVLGVSVSEYFFYAMFNYLSPIMTLIFALFKIKIKQLAPKEPIKNELP